MPEMLNVELSLENCFLQMVSSLAMFPHISIFKVCMFEVLQHRCKERSCKEIYLLCTFVPHKLFSTRAEYIYSSQVQKVKKHDDVSNTETVDQGLMQAISLLQARGFFSLSLHGGMVEKLSAMMIFLGIRLSWQTISPKGSSKDHTYNISSPRSIRALYITQGFLA